MVIVSPELSHSSLPTAPLTESLPRGAEPPTYWPSPPCRYCCTVQVLGAALDIQGRRFQQGRVGPTGSDPLDHVCDTASGRRGGVGGCAGMFGSDGVHRAGRCDQR